jgi:preprotein translocase SecE subunit
MVSPWPYLKSAYLELTKVTWPPKRTIFRHTLLVIISIALATLFVGLIDGALTALVRILLERS